MIVCVCNALSESEIVATAQAGGGASAEEVYAQLGCQPRCRRCLDYADGLVGEARTPAQRAVETGPLEALPAA
jgi:bacterioferritin-associated ferredoxin